MGATGQNSFSHQGIVTSGLLCPRHHLIYQLSFCPNPSRGHRQYTDPCLHIRFGAPHQKIVDEHTHQQISNDNKSTAWLNKGRSEGYHMYAHVYNVITCDDLFQSLTMRITHHLNLVEMSIVWSQPPKLCLEITPKLIQTKHSFSVFF